MIRTSGIINSSVTNTRFNVYSSKEIEKISVVKITSAKSLDLGGNPIDNGLYDARFGPLRQEDICATCGLTGRHCPGHCGHIELPLLCLNPNFIDDIRKLLAMTCFKKNCHRILYSKDFKQEFTQAVKEAYEGNCAKALSLDKKIVQTEIDLDEAENEKKAKADLYEDPEEYATYLKMQKNPKIQQTTHIGEILNDLVKHFFRKTKSRNCPHCMQPIGKIKIIRGFKFFHYEDAGVIKNMGKVENDSDSEEEFDNVEDFENKFQVRNNAFLMTEEIRKVLKEMYKEEWNLINAIFNIKGGPNFELFSGVLFIDRLMVTPSRFRPIAMRAEQKYEGQQTTMYAKIIESCVSIQDNNRELMKLNNSEYEIDEVTGKKVRGIDGLEIQTLAEEEKEDKIKMIQRTMNHAVDSLQQRVGEIFNGDLNKTDPVKPVGVKQILEKKKGLFRMNIMGKRVNFSARSVAGPDPYISTVEVGIPEMFAKTLTYPVGVTPFNAKELANLVRNGPNNYPGAYAIIDGDGQKVLISKDALKREKQASHLTLCAEDGNIKRVSVVLRHIRNGDSLLVNRQPTLHKGSIMAHKARILQGGNTVKIHYANCKSYNADFDGDEINVHALQNEEARAEALMLMSSEQMYVSAKDGGPLAGLIQDHMIAGFHMMVRDTFLTREQYMQLCWSALDCVDRISVRVKTLPPAIFKPVPMWTGKQVISTLLINLIGRGETGITFRSSAKVSNKSWVEKHVKSGEYLDRAPYGPKWMDGKEYSMDESRVLVRDSEFLQGILDKSQTGASKFGFVHYIFELHGANKSGQVLTAITRVGTEFLKTIQGFTLGLADVQINSKCDVDRKAKKKLLNKDLSMKLKEEYNIEDEDDLTLTSRRAIKNAYADISGAKSAELDQRIKGLANMKGNEFKDVTRRLVTVKKPKKSEIDFHLFLVISKTIFKHFTVSWNDEISYFEHFLSRTLL